MTEIPEHLRQRAREAQAKAAYAAGTMPKGSLLKSMAPKPPLPPVKKYDGYEASWKDAMENARKALFEAEHSVGGDTRESYSNLATAWICYADAVRKYELQQQLEFIKIRDDILEELEE